MKILAKPRHAFLLFALCGLLDCISTMLLISHFGIGVERNPLVRAGFGAMSYAYFLPHFATVLVAAFMLSRPSWNDTMRFKIKSMLFVLYCYVLVINWYQVAMISRELFPRLIGLFLLQPVS